MRMRSSAVSTMERSASNNAGEGSTRVGTHSASMEWMAACRPTCGWQDKHSKRVRPRLPTLSQASQHGLEMWWTSGTHVFG